MQVKPRKNIINIEIVEKGRLLARLDHRTDPDAVYTAEEFSRDGPRWKRIYLTENESIETSDENWFLENFIVLNG